MELVCITLLYVIYFHLDGLLLFPTTFSITWMGFGPVSFSAYDSYDMVNKPERIFRYYII